MSYSVFIDGFRTKEQAKEFYKWYKEQGESDTIIDWMEVAGQNPDNYNVDMKDKPTWVDDTYVFKIQGEK